MSRATAQRWKAKHAAALKAAADDLVAEALAGLRSTLGAAGRRLLREIENDENGGVGVTAARVAYSAYRDLTQYTDLEERLQRLEAAVAARPAPVARAGERLRWGGSLAPVTPLQPQPKKAEP